MKIEDEGEVKRERKEEEGNNKNVMYFKFKDDDLWSKVDKDTLYMKLYQPLDSSIISFYKPFVYSYLLSILLTFVNHFLYL